MSPVATGDSKVAGRAVAQSTLSRRSLTVGMVAGCLAPGLSRAGAHRYRAPRTANGQPNLQGIWTNAWFTRLERPEELKQLVITPEEARQAAFKFQIDPTACALSGGEDYELLFTIPQSEYDKLVLNEEISVVGYITEPEKGARIITKGGGEHPLTAQGWTHV